MVQTVLSCSLVVLLAATALQVSGQTAKKQCRSQPRDSDFPVAKDWASLNHTVGGRLFVAVPSAKFCPTTDSCDPRFWTNALFREVNPGSMLEYNWEQDYDSQPPSVCIRGSNSTPCGQGNVPLYAVKAQSVSDVQAAVKFANSRNLRLSVKASGHDYLGRSTAKNSLLIYTHDLNNLTFVDEFKVAGKNKGSAVIAGSGVPLNQIYHAGIAAGKIFVGGTAATVVAGGGYIQGAGHSALSPLLGLAADNALEFKIVVANGTLLTANEAQNSDLFWALRGGGSGSWGVIISVTLKTFPTITVVYSTTVFQTNSSEQAGAVAAVHAKHIFDWDHIRPGQYFYLFNSPQGPVVSISTFFPNVTQTQAVAAYQPFLSDIQALGIQYQQEYNVTTAQEALFQSDDILTDNVVVGSRFFSDAVYRNSAKEIGKMHTDLFNGGAAAVLTNLVAGGKVAQNANINSAVTPAWRKAKTHMIAVNQWTDADTIEHISILRKLFQTSQVALLEKIAGGNSGSYSNEGDVFEPAFQTTYFGPNYARLSEVKKKYDPKDLFIVPVGVGSERWDAQGLCRVG